MNDSTCSRTDRNRKGNRTRWRRMKEIRRIGVNRFVVPFTGVPGL
jgi:hypothetical protein